ncbi:hypothetical protein BKA62DRAFT_661378 [Auriculariales sp. MPI-PUGE-AT-0066]|nr:hypothetical protein BKA62DRAFT_661378 [Auriculariales sp. MPI-PUGE-AT-0066]
MSDSSPSRTMSTTPASDAALQGRIPLAQPGQTGPRPVTGRWQSTRLRVEGFAARPRAQTVSSPTAPAPPDDYLAARSVPTTGDPNDPDFKPGLPQRRRSRTLSLSNPLKRQSRPPVISPVEEHQQSNIPPSPDDIDPNYIQARNRYNQQVVDFLDAIDPEVSTMTNLADVQNSLFVPNLGAYLDRSRPFRLTRPPEKPKLDVEKPLPEPPIDGVERHDTDASSIIRAGEYLVMPAGCVDWGKLTDKERRELDEYVHFLLTSKRERMRRAWRGFKQYVGTPLGAFVVTYASLLTFWGATWVLFIIGWLSGGSRQKYFIEICDQILTALFCTVGIGLAPFRAVDTYHMINIARLHTKSLRLRDERHLEPLPDKNDLPADEATKRRERVLSEREQLLLEYHQNKFSSSHTFYRPHETDTHRAFPLDLLIAVVCILDCHSLFQIALGSATWSISYHKEYKSILTSVILSLSISCNITGGVIIAIGNRRTRKQDVLERRLHEALSEEAIRRKEKAHRKQIMHESLEHKEARLKAEKEAEPGVMEQVKDKVTDEVGAGSSTGLLDRITGRRSEDLGSRHGRKTSRDLHDLERSGSASAVLEKRRGTDSTLVPSPVVPQHAKSAKGSLDMGYAKRAALDKAETPKTVHETDDEHR